MEKAVMCVPGPGMSYIEMHQAVTVRSLTGDAVQRW